MAVPRVTVVLPTRNRAVLLEGALDGLARQRTDGSFSYHVIVVDNGSTDTTPAVIAAARAQFPVPLTCLHEPRVGAAEARNAAISPATGEWLAFIDDDELADPGWLGELLRAAAGSPSRVVGGAVHAHLPDGVADTVSRVCRESVLRERTAGSYGGRTRRMCGHELPGCDNLLVARTLVRRLGGFDVSLRYGHDHDFAWRARRAGAELWFAPDALVHHRLMPDRLRVGSFRLEELRSGASRAHFDHRYRGALPLVALWAARAARAVAVDLPALTHHQLAGDAVEAVGRRCRLWRFAGYSRQAAHLLLPFPWSVRRRLEIIDGNGGEGAI
jgi:succinoglycan biosynthesis protein ExoM